MLEIGLVILLWLLALCILILSVLVEEKYKKLRQLKLSINNEHDIYNSLKNSYEQLSADYAKYQDEKFRVEEEIKKLKDDMNFLTSELERKTESINKEIIWQRQKTEWEYQDIQREQEVQLQECINDIISHWNEKEKDIRCNIEKYQSLLLEEQKKVNSAIEVAKRTNAEKDEQNKYKIILSDAAIHDIREIERLKDFINSKDILGKLIWKTYIERPTNDMIARVIPNQEAQCGIYKITNINNQMCYVGQSVDIASRWKQHIKCAVGATTPTNNLLYPAMVKEGIWNFTFEVIELCPKDKLNNLEDYWQNFYKAKEYGYSIV